MRQTSQKDMADLLTTLGVQPGDRVMVHSFIPSLGVVEGGLAGMMKVFRDVLGPEGTVIVPTYTYSYRRNEIFDVVNSKSVIGAFTEYVRQLDDAYRNNCPLFSMAGFGPESREILHRKSPNCFGEESVYQQIFAAGVKFLGLGVDWEQGFAFFMHLERLANVPMRKDQFFEGQSRNEAGKIHVDRARHAVRVTEPAWKRNRTRYCRTLVKNGYAAEVEADGCAHRLLDSRIILPVVLDDLAKEPWIMADQELCSDD
jgi:aminoglycoside 3-N-acetyltransferase